MFTHDYRFVIHTPLPVDSAAWYRGGLVTRRSWFQILPESVIFSLTQKTSVCLTSWLRGKVCKFRVVKFITKWLIKQQTQTEGDDDFVLNNYSGDVYSDVYTSAGENI